METSAEFLLVLLLTGAVRGFQWSDKLREDDGPLHVCSGDNIQLFFNYTLDRGERVKGMVWACQPEGKNEGVLATYEDDQFLPVSAFSGRLAPLQDGGIEVHCATIMESGMYTVAISVEGEHNVLRLHRKTASVQVVDAPKAQSGELHVSRKEEAVRDVTHGTWHVQLSCGNFSDRGHPPVDVLWKTPRGDRLNSSSHEDGFFQLLVPNPPVGGNYCCSIPPSMPAARCLTGHSPLLDTVCVEVDETAARFLLLEARLQEYTERWDVQSRQWMEVAEDIANRTDELQHWRDEAVENAVPVYFHARLSSVISQSSGAILKLNKVVSNEGKGYDPDTGIFTAPVNGSYFFIGTAEPNGGGSHTNMGLMYEGLEVARTYVTQYSGNNAMGSCHASLYLTAGEKIWLQSFSDNKFHSTSTFFSGFRI